MKLFWGLFTFAAAVSAGPVLVTNPVSLTGSGTWSFSFIDGEAAQFASASGSNGVDSVSFSYNSDCAGAGTPSIWVTVNGGCATASSIGASIDGVSSPLFSVQLGGSGSGVLNLYNSSNQLVASADLIGWVNVVHLAYDGPPSDPDMSGDGAFAIAAVPDAPSMSGDGTLATSAVPDAPSWLTTLAGLAWLLKRRSN